MGFLQTPKLVGWGKEIDKFDSFLWLVKEDLTWSDIADFFINSVEVSGTVNDLVDDVCELLFAQVLFLLSSSLNFLL